MSSCNVLTGPKFELPFGSSGYPPQLRQVNRPPQRLYGIGNPEALAPGVAVIGARKASPYGLACARIFAEQAARRGAVIISGGARGCDQEAHRAALAAGAPTVVVLASGADVPYPKTARSLFQEVIESGGAVVSENPWGTQPLPALFPQRNRIIAGLSMLLLIAEAGLPSGTFSTADAALSAGREVAVVPGSVFSPNAKGSNQLILDGAHMVTGHEEFGRLLDDAFQTLPLSLSEPEPLQSLPDAVAQAADADPVLRALAADAYAPDELTAYFGLSSAELLKRLSQYELQGLVQQGRDGRYQLCGAPSGLGPRV